MFFSSLWARFISVNHSSRVRTDKFLIVNYYCGKYLLCYRRNCYQARNVACSIVKSLPYYEERKADHTVSNSTLDNSVELCLCWSGLDRFTPKLLAKPHTPKGSGLPNWHRGRVLSTDFRSCICHVYLILYENDLF